MSDDTARTIAALRKQGYTIKEPAPTPPPRYCDKCKTTEDEAGYLADFTITVCESEEGYSEVRLLLCEDHMPAMCESLMELGFLSHRHGTTSSLEDVSCPGYKGGPCQWGEVEYGPEGQSL